MKNGQWNQQARRFMCVLALVASTAASAQDDKEVVTEGGVSYNRKTVINFEDDTIEGDLKTPDASLTRTTPRVRHRNLIRARQHFQRAVLGSITSL